MKSYRENISALESMEHGRCLSPGIDKLLEVWISINEHANLAKQLITAKPKLNYDLIRKMAGKPTTAMACQHIVSPKECIFPCIWRTTNRCTSVNTVKRFIDDNMITQHPLETTYGVVNLRYVLPIQYTVDDVEVALPLEYSLKIFTTLVDNELVCVVLFPWSSGRDFAFVGNTFVDDENDMRFEHTQGLLHDTRNPYHSFATLVQQYTTTLTQYIVIDAEDGAMRLVHDETVMTNLLFCGHSYGSCIAQGVASSMLQRKHPLFGRIKIYGSGGGCCMTKQRANELYENASDIHLYVVARFYGKAYTDNPDEFESVQDTLHTYRPYVFEQLLKYSKCISAAGENIAGGITIVDNVFSHHSTLEHAGRLPTTILLKGKKLQQIDLNTFEYGSNHVVDWTLVTSPAPSSRAPMPTEIGDAFFDIFLN